MTSKIPYDKSTNKPLRNEVCEAAMAMRHHSQLTRVLHGMDCLQDVVSSIKTPLLHLHECIISSLEEEKSFLSEINQIISKNTSNHNYTRLYNAIINYKYEEKEVLKNAKLFDSKNTQLIRNPEFLERCARQFYRIFSYHSMCSDVALVKESHIEVLDFKKALRCHIESLFLEICSTSLSKNDIEPFFLSTLLRTFLFLDNFKTDLIENTYREHIIRPIVYRHLKNPAFVTILSQTCLLHKDITDNICISDFSNISNSHNTCDFHNILSLLYQDLYPVIHPFIEATQLYINSYFLTNSSIPEISIYRHYQLQTQISYTFNFISCVWSEIRSVLSKYDNLLYAPGIPIIFRCHYIECSLFLSRLESLLPKGLLHTQFISSTDYIAFKNRWQTYLHVYKELIQVSQPNTQL